MTRKLVGVCGFISSGKGTVGEILTDHYGFTKISYADRLKDTLATLFSWDREMLEGNTPESREWREQPDPYWSEELGYDLTPRVAMQRVGTDCLRKGFADDVWVLVMKQTLLQHPDTDFVVPDVRFFNERDLLRDMGGEIWQVQRGQQPEWTSKAISDNRYGTSWMTDHPEIHESEWRWMDENNQFDLVIQNNHDRDELFHRVKAKMDRWNKV